MDDIGRHNELVFARSLEVGSRESELMLTLSIPLEANEDLFRVGWDLRKPGRGKYVAITTGRALWERREPSRGATYIAALIEECNRLLEPQRRNEHC